MTYRDPPSRLDSSLPYCPKSRISWITLTYKTGRDETIRQLRLEISSTGHQSPAKPPHNESPRLPRRVNLETDGEGTRPREQIPKAQHGRSYRSLRPPKWIGLRSAIQRVRNQDLNHIRDESWVRPSAESDGRPRQGTDHCRDGEINFDLTTMTSLVV